MARHAPARALGALLLLGVWIALLGVAAGTSAGAAADTTPHARVISVRDSPGYRPLVDPESMAVVVGRRLDAPLVHKPFRGGARSLEDLGRRVCRALHHSDRDSLLELCVTDDEFRDILWREFPQSRPVVGLTWMDAWTVLYARLHAGCSHAVRDYGGHAYEFVRFAKDSTAHYRNFTLYSRLTLVVRDDEGQTQEWKWLRAVAERKGAFKIYSTDD